MTKKQIINLIKENKNLYHNEKEHAKERCSNDWKVFAEREYALQLLLEEIAMYEEDEK